MAVPPTLTEQGRSFDAQGAPVTMRLNLTLSLYETDAGDASVWTETQAVDLEDGYFRRGARQRHAAARVGPTGPAGPPGHRASAANTWAFRGGLDKLFGWRHSVEQAMGWDIEFYVRFGSHEPPVRRFARAFEVICAQPGTKALRSFEMARRFASGRDGDVKVEISPADVDLVRQRLAAHADEPGWHAEATWTWEETVYPDGGEPTAVGDALTLAVPRQTYRLGSETAAYLLPPGGPPDLVIDAFDYRRYFPRVGDMHAWWQDLPPEAPACQLARMKIDALMRRLVPIVELGATSLWGMRGGDKFSPDTIYAVFHRDPERYRDDGATPPLPDVCLTNDVVQEAAVRVDYLCAPTSAGPIVHDARLGYGTLHAFYESLRYRLEAKGDREALDADH